MSTQREIQDLRIRLQLKIVDKTTEYVEFNVSEHYRVIFIYQFSRNEKYLKQELLWGLDGNTSS